MLTRIRIKNFKKLDDVDIELGKSVVFIGPNNSGKTTALQALTLWDIGLRQWNAKRGGKASPEKRPGVTINRRDLIAIPVPSANLLWRDLHVRNVRKSAGVTEKTQNIRVDIIVEGVTKGDAWSCGLEFDFSNEESFVCRPVRQAGYEDVPVKNARFTSVPDAACQLRVAFLPPMSGLAAVEPKWDQGRINVLLGEGQTAQVLRNLCFQIYQKKDDSAHETWQKLAGHIADLFGVKILPPEHLIERGEITMEYEEASGARLDLSSSGRGLQQTLLLLAHLYANPGTILLLDEPDAHLEILRQRQTYRLLSQVAEAQGSQVISASHSEVVLNEAGTTGVVVAFVGKPHRINDRGSQLLKSLTEIGWESYYNAEQTGWVLYVEDASDLAILQAFARTLNHPAAALLERPFVHYVSTNVPQKARDHFYGLREARGDLVGVALFDRLEKELQKDQALVETMWHRREIENYFCTEQVLIDYARGTGSADLFDLAESDNREQVMRDALRDVTQALQTLNKPDPWSKDVKASDDFLDPLFRKYFRDLAMALVLRKSDYHLLASLLPADQIDPEVNEKLDMIVRVAHRAKPKTAR